MSTTACRDARLEAGMDLTVERFDDGALLVEALTGIHCGAFILWSAERDCLAIGPESWCRAVHDGTEREWAKAEIERKLTAREATR